MDREARRILIILVSIILMFISLIVYLTGFQIFKAEEIKENSYNKRLWINEEKVIRGSILDRNGLELVRSEKTDEGSRRIYEYGKLYSHSLGYSYREYGKAGLESKYNKTLLGLEESSTINEIRNLLKEEKYGNNIRTSLDHGLQSKSRELLVGNKGSIIVMNPKTGEIYSMVSYPDFDAGNLREDWTSITENMDGPLLNRSIQGLYEPGSTFKILLAASLEENKDIDQDFICEGTSIIDGYKFKDYNEKAHGPMDLNSALIKSCNTYFVNKALEIGKDRLGETSEKFYINKDIPFDLPVEKSRFNYRDKMGKTEIAASGIGQGKVLMTPLNMLMITSTIANDGKMMQASLIKDIISYEGELIRSNEPVELAKPLGREEAIRLKYMLENVVKEGTGKNARIDGISVAGKTGTAENKSGKSHAWFTGFAPVEDPEVAVVVLLEENGSTGGSTAAPIARELIKYTINNIKK